MREAWAITLTKPPSSSRTLERILSAKKKVTYADFDPPEAKKRIAVPGLELVVSYTGVKSYVLRRKLKGRVVVVTLGRHPSINVETARKQSAKAWELRAATSFAELLGEQGEKQQARDLLDGVYSWFSEGLESQDMKRAGRLLDQLT